MSAGLLGVRRDVPVGRGRVAERPTGGDALDALRTSGIALPNVTVGRRDLHSRRNDLVLSRRDDGHRQLSH
jgi:hypothetical protein